MMLGRQPFRLRFFNDFDAATDGLAEDTDTARRGACVCFFSPLTLTSVPAGGFQIIVVQKYAQIA